MRVLNLDMLVIRYGLEHSVFGLGWRCGSIIQQTSDGGYVVAGKRDPSFKLRYHGFLRMIHQAYRFGLRRREFSSQGAAYSVQQTTDGGYSWWIRGEEPYQLWVAKLVH